MTDCVRVQPFASELAKILSNPDNAVRIEYKWRDITKMSTAGLPQVLSDLIKVTKSCSDTYSAAQQLIDFRQHFSEVWHQIPMSDTDSRLKMLEWVVKTWGRINRISNQRLLEYVTAVEKNSPTEERISSQSKCFAFVYPESRFVFDSRVARVLNYILLTKFPEEDWQFPLAQGRGPTFENFKKQWKQRRVSVNYDFYCLLIKETAKLMKPKLTGAEVQRVEFNLFMLGEKDKIKNAVM